MGKGVHVDFLTHLLFGDDASKCTVISDYGKKKHMLIPDYYTSFRCKIDRCRAACCNGWPVTFSMRDYFRLLSLNCTEQTKSRLDRALHLTTHPTEEEYALILPGYDGNCPMFMKDGRCSIQAELDENALPTVCRLYPRGIREMEASCSNSCEAVVELLHRKEAIRFDETGPVEETVQTRRIHFFETGGRETGIRLWLISFIQDRRYALPERLYRMGKALRLMDEALISHDSDKIQSLLTDEKKVDAVFEKADRHEALQNVCAMLEKLDLISDNIREYGSIAVRRLSCDDKREYHDAMLQFLNTAPDWEAWFENLLVNHMFFSQFPFQDRPVSLTEEITALFSVYALLRFMTIGAGDGTTERLVDIIAALFRLVDHTQFDRLAVPLLHNSRDAHRLLLSV